MKSISTQPMVGFYTILGAAAFLQCDEKTVRNLIARGVLRRLPHLRPYRIPEADVHAMLVVPARAKSRRPLGVCRT